LALAILGWLGWRLASDWAEAAPPWPTPSLTEFIGATASGAGALALLAGLFVGLLVAVGQDPSPHRAYAWRSWLQSYFYRYVPGRVVLVVERVRMGAHLGIPRSTSVILVFWETLLLLVGACALAAVGVLLGDGALVGAPSLGSVAVLGLAGALGLLSIAPALRVAARYVPSLGRKLPHLVLDVGVAPQAVLAVGYAVVWLLLGLSFAWTCRWFDAGADAGAAEVIWFVLAYVAGLVVGVTPAGLGVREGLLVAGLATRYPPGTAIAFALTSRVLMTIVELAMLGCATRIRPPDATPVDGAIDGAFE